MDGLVQTTPGIRKQCHAQGEQACQIACDVVLPVITSVGEEKPGNSEEDSHKGITCSETIIITDGRQELKRPEKEKPPYRQDNRESDAQDSHYSPKSQIGDN